MVQITFSPKPFAREPFGEIKMQLLQQTKPALIFCGILLWANFACAETDAAAQESYLKARAKEHQADGHGAHVGAVEKSSDFHGVFYGFLPCDDCNGIKVTLSLKQKNNYLMVTQLAKESTREFYEKGKYTWDEENQTVVLTPRNQSIPRHYRIKDEGTLVQLDNGGRPITGDEAERYILRRSDTVKNREVHIH